MIKDRFPGPVPRRAVGDERGTIAVVMALTFSIVLLGVGAAIDYLRWHQAHESTAAAIDAAVLAGGLALQMDPLNVQNALATARRTHVANMAQRLPVLSDSVDFSTTDNNQTMMAQGKAEISTTVLGAFGFPRLGLVSSSGTDLRSHGRRPGRQQSRSRHDARRHRLDV